nr:MAG TPA: hypothetical protein [Bacteriophage sp.]
MLYLMPVYAACNFSMLFNSLCLNVLTTKAADA